MNSDFLTFLKAKTFESICNNILNGKQIQEIIDKVANTNILDNKGLTYDQGIDKVVKEYLPKEKYWLISYVCTSPKWENPIYSNDACKGSVCDWILKCMKHQENVEVRLYETYTILNTLEITKQEFEKIDGMVG